MKSYKKEFTVLFLIVATELIGFGLIIPILPLISLRYESNTILIGVLMAAYSFAQFIAAPILGRLSDRYGRKPLLALSKLGTVIAYIVFAYAHSFELILFARLLDGFTGGNISIARAYIADITTPEDRPKGMAIIGIAFGTGFILGPALGGFLYQDGGTHFIPAIVSGALSLIAVFATLLYLKEPEKHTKTTSQLSFLQSGTILFSKQSFIIICFLQLIFMVMFSGFESTFALYTNFLFAYNEKQNSILFVYVGLLTLLIQGSIARRPSKTPKRLILVGMIAASAGLCLLAVATSLITMCLALAFLSLGMALFSSYLPSILSTDIEKKNQGLAMGVYESIGSLSRIIGPIIAGSAIALSMRGYFGSLSTVLILTIIVFFLYNRFSMGQYATNASK